MSVLWSKIEIGDDPAATLDACLKELSVDERHPLWMIEECGDGMVAAIKKCEEDLLRHVAFDRKERADNARLRWTGIRRWTTSTAACGTTVDSTPRAVPS